VSELLDDLRNRWDRKEDVDEARLRSLFENTDERVRALAVRMMFEQTMRPALDAIANALAAEGRWDVEADWVSKGAQLARHDEPVPLMLKGAGLAALARGDLDAATNLLFHAMVVAMRKGQAGNARSRRLMRYAHDPDFDRAYETIASRLSAPRYYRPQGERLRVAVMIPFDREGNSVGLVAGGLVVGLCQRGIDAFIVTTGMVPSPPGTSQRQAIEAVGSCLIEPPAGSILEKTQWLLDHFERDPVHAVVYLSDPQDVVPRLCEIVGLANAQLFVNAAFEHRTGRLDAVIQTVEPTQIERSVRKEIATFVATGIVRDRAILSAVPAKREDLGIAPEAVVLATFGRLSKLAQRGFLEATMAILQAEPKAIWMIAGGGSDDEMGAIDAAARTAAVEKRIVRLGEQGTAIPSLLKMSDVYLDPFPFPGAQSTGEAMFAGLPVVAMRREHDQNLDPTTVGPTTAAGEAMIGDAAAMAACGDIAGYVQLALRYVNDPAERRRVGEALRARAERALTWNGMIDGYREIIERAVAQRAPAGDGELAAIVVVPSAQSLERVIALIKGDRGVYAASRIIVVINGPHPDEDLRAARYGNRIQTIRLAEECDFAGAARAAISQSDAPLCAILDGTVLPRADWTAEGVAEARRHGWGRIAGGVVVDARRDTAVDAALAALGSALGAVRQQASLPEPLSQQELAAVYDRYEGLEEFSARELAELERQPIPTLKVLAHRIRFERLAGPALDAAIRLAALGESHTDELIAFLEGAMYARHPKAYVAAMKLRASRLLSAGDIDGALVSVGRAIQVGMGAGQAGVRRWHPLFSVANDPYWDEFFEAAAARFGDSRTYPARLGDRRRFAIVVSLDYPANSLSIVGSRLGVGLRKLGYDVCYASTEYYPSFKNSPTTRELARAGARVVFAGGETFMERANDLLRYFEREPVDAALYLVDPADPIARVLEIVRLANAQALVTAGFDQRSGRIDAFVHTVDERQVPRAIHPERSVFISTGIARDREVLAARPVSRSEFGMRGEDIVLATVGRLNKSVQREFLHAVLGAMQRNPKLKWLLIGGRDDHALGVLDKAIGAAGVAGRVQWVGAIHELLPAYLTAADIYCDTFPFPGGQSLGEAMFAGLPVVAMKRVQDADLDPSGCGPTSATAEAFIGDTVPMVAAGDTEGYARRILEYAEDPQLRLRDGTALRERALAKLGWDQMVARYAEMLDSIAQRAAVLR